MVSPSSRRRAVKLAVEEGLGRTSQACRALRLPRSSYYRNRVHNPGNHQAQERIVVLSQQHPRYGYRRKRALLRREGLHINAKRVQRVRRQAELQASKRQRRMKRRGTSTAERQHSTGANDVWSWDFVEDQTENGSRFRILVSCQTNPLDNAGDYFSIFQGASEAAMSRRPCPSEQRGKIEK